MNLAFVTTYNAKNIVNWSGLGYHISLALENSGNKLQYIGDLRQNTTPLNFIKKVCYSRVLNKQFPIERTVAAAVSYSKEVSRHLVPETADFIFSLGTLPIAYLNSKIPTVIYTDATFASMLGYYNSFSDLSAETIRLGHALEKRALESCAMAIYASEWAARSAVNDYKISPSKVKVVPFGANISREHSRKELALMVENRSSDVLKILFNGVDWQRKGGPLVMKTAEELIRRGVKLELHVVGLKTSPWNPQPSYIINHGYLNKHNEAQAAELDQLYRDCHFLFLPSEAEAFGIVFSEASANGMPSIAKATGGITTAISNGRNGYALLPGAGAMEYADIIGGLFANTAEYRDLAISSNDEYVKRLNWNVAGKEITALLHSMKK